ncbi:RING finger protein 10 [Nymphaea thermarum]|nr:RING finger protein 10 [Nymphaea thermarum]
MSILPSDAKGSPSSSADSRSENPNFDNGVLQVPELLGLHGCGGGDLGAYGSDPVDTADSLSVVSAGTIAAPTANCSVSSNRATNGRGPTVRKNFGQSLHLPSGCRTSEQGGLPFEPRSEQLSGKQIATGNLHSNPVHQSARKSQMMNANHLLNFHYDPISRPQQRALPPRRQQKVKPYNKDLFLQANYKFVILDADDRTIESMDPDKMLEWEDIICVRYSSPNPVQCPICLERPLCPQITSCGHIFCFPCILRYLLMGEEDHKGDCWKKCPLCFTMVSVKDLYTIYIDYVKKHHVGDRMDFALLTRAKDSMVPLEKNSNASFNDGNGGSFCDTFSKLTVTSDVELSVREAKLELNDWLAKAEVGKVEDLELLPYVCAALEQLDQRKKLWTEHQVFSSSPKNSAAYHVNTKPCKYTPVKNLSHAIKVKSMHENRFSHTLYINHEPCSSELDRQTMVKEVEEKVFALDEDDKGLQKQSGDGSNTQEKDYYTFYQSVDGQLLILHPLNMKCLLRHYGSHDLLPPRIGGEILQLETVTQSEAMRKRYRFLSHFSLTTTFQLCEIDMTGILPPEALSPFMDEIKRREYQRKRRVKQESEEKARGMAAEGAASIYTRPVNSSNTTFSENDFQALGTSPASSTSPPVGDRKLFSDVTRLGFAAACDSPSLRTEQSVEASATTSGEASCQSCPRSATALSFASIMSAARTPDQAEVVKMNGLGKKGKKASRVLLSTAGGRRY